MTGFLLDTNVVSELNRPRLDAAVLAFLINGADLWLSAVVLHELEFGVQQLQPGRRRELYRQTLSDFVAQYIDRILPVGRTEAVQAASLRAHARRMGRVLHLGDALIAGTAQAHNFAVATRNVRDFAGLGVAVVDPWEG